MRIVFLFLLICLTAASTAVADDTEGKVLRFGFTHMPPSMILNNNGHSGSTVDIAKIIAERFGARLEIHECPRARCLSSLKGGKIDLMGGVFKTDDREEHMHFLEPPYTVIEPLVFYFQKGKGQNIKKYEDLLGLNIGVIIGVSYFEPFDSDSQLRKHGVSTLLQLIRMLSAGRIDAFPTIVSLFKANLKEYGYTDSFEASPYVHSKKYRFYFVLSKKSPLTSKLKNFQEAVKIPKEAMDEILRKYDLPGKP